MQTPPQPFWACSVYTFARFHCHCEGLTGIVGIVVLVGDVAVAILSAVAAAEAFIVAVSK